MTDNKTSESKSMVHIGTRVPETIESDLLEICKVERRKISPLVALMIEEYLDVRKVMTANKLTLPDISLTGDLHIETDKLIEGDELILRLTQTDGLNDKTMYLNADAVIKLTANLFTFLIECKING